jgi:uncharacterized protein YukJ
LATKGVHV